MMDKTQSARIHLLPIVLLALSFATAVGCGGAARSTSAPMQGEAVAASESADTAGGEAMVQAAPTNASDNLHFSVNGTDTPTDASNQLIGFDAHTATVGDNADDDRALFERLQANLATRLRVADMDGDIPSAPPSAESTDEAGEAASELAEADCSEARRIRDDICVVSERICEIADRNPDREDVAEVCEDGAERCLRARGDVAATCGPDTSQL